MTAERFEILRRCFQKGLTVNLKTFQLYYKKSGKKLKYIRYNNKDYVIINKQVWWVPMVLSAYLGFDVIETTWIPKDGNHFNYHPGNYLLLTQAEKEIYMSEKCKTKLSWEEIDRIRNLKLPIRANKLKQMAEHYGLTFRQFRALKYDKHFTVFGLNYNTLKKHNKIA